MGGTLTQQRRVNEEGLRVVKFCQEGRRSSDCKPLSLGTKKMTVPKEEAPANYVPAAAVIRREQALSGFIGRKERVGGLLSQM